MTEISPDSQIVDETVGRDLVEQNEVSSTDFFVIHHGEHTH